MRKIGLFVEDVGHETFLTALLTRLAKEQRIEINYQTFNVRGGHGKVVTELKQYLRDLEHGHIHSQDLLIIATDANCKGFQERKRELSSITKKTAIPISYAIPDPHIERWLLLDSAAFKKTLGFGCHAPDKKCEKDRYKHLLIEAVRKAGIIPLLSGMEHAEDIVNTMNLQKIAQIDAAFGDLLQNLRTQFELWKIL